MDVVTDEKAAQHRAYPPMEWTRERVARFWDWQSRYPETYFTYQFGPAIAAAFKPYLKGCRRIVDFGCGTGFLIPHLCPLAPEVYGADPSTESIRFANERLKGMNAFKGAFLIDELINRGLQFDAILCVEVVEHLDDAVLDKLLSEIRSLLAPGGVAIFSTPNDEDLSRNMILCPASGELFHRWQHVRSWNRETLPARLRSAGFAVDRVIETNMAVPRGSVPVRLLKTLVKRLLFGPAGRPHLVCVVGSAAPVGLGR